MERKLQLRKEFLDAWLQKFDTDKHSEAVAVFFEGPSVSGGEEDEPSARQTAGMFDDRSTVAALSRCSSTSTQAKVRGFQRGNQSSGSGDMGADLDGSQGTAVLRKKKA